MQNASNNYLPMKAFGDSNELKLPYEEGWKGE